MELCFGKGDLDIKDMRRIKIRCNRAGDWKCDLETICVDACKISPEKRAAEEGFLPDTAQRLEVYVNGLPFHHGYSLRTLMIDVSV